jgi:alpha-D-ribose 1-methylphosphonate 5-triphosphate diphosphatase
MDHSPGSVSSPTEKYREYYQGKYLSRCEMARYEEEQLALAAQWSQPNRLRLPPCAATAISRWPAMTTPRTIMCESHQLGSVIAEFPTTFEAARPHAARHERADGRAEHRARRFALRQRGGKQLASSACWIFSRPTTTPPACWMRHSGRRRRGNRFTLPQAIRLVTKNPARRLIFTIAARLPKVNGRIWCWRTAKASIFISTTSGVREKGCSDGKTDLVNGAVRLR